MPRYSDRPIAIWLMVSDIALSSSMLALISSIAEPCEAMFSLIPTVLSTMLLMVSDIWLSVVAISSLVFVEEIASFPTSSATTAKPLPASPALAASIDAFSDRRLVWEAMSWMSSMIFSEASTDSVMISVDFTISACFSATPAVSFYARL